MTPRELRVWHYRRALSAALSAAKYTTDTKYAKRYQKEADARVQFHMAAVATLNPFCDMHFVEDDHKTFPLPHSTRHKRL